MRVHLISLSCCALVCGCSTVHNTPTDSPADLKKQIVELQKSQAQQNSQIEDLNNKIAMLKDQLEAKDPNQLPMPPRTKSAPAPVEVKPVAVSPAIESKPEAAEIKVKSLAPVAANKAETKSVPNTDPAGKIYDEVVSKTRKNQDPSKDIALLISKYKDSPFTNNTLYFYGESLYEKGNFVKSAEQFERLYTLFPDGNKAVPALYNLALCYQKMGHPAEAQEAFQNIVSLYPGSREALAAEKQIVGEAK